MKPVRMMMATSMPNPVKPAAARASAPPMAMTVPSLVQLNSELNCPQTKQNTT